VKICYVFSLLVLGNSVLDMYNGVKRVCGNNVIERVGKYVYLSDHSGNVPSPFSNKL